MNHTVSLCMIVKNEEKYLTKCLNSVKDIVDEMIIVDTGSNDRTVEIARSFGAKLYFYKWNNSFSDARNESLKYASKDFILIMDGDDEFCSGDIDKFKKLINGNLDENAVYLFETYSYCGSSVEENNITINLNPRLFKNNHGFKYAGEIHNQLVNKQYEVKDISENIRIYHYGYLDDIMKKKDKKNRNIPILKEQLRKDPQNKFAHFNIGTEYFVENNLEKALEHYYEAYKDFNPYSGFGYFLVIRMMVINYNLGEYEKVLEIADDNAKYYPQLTDLHFVKAMVYNALNKPTLEIKALKKCIELGEPPSQLKFIYGTWGYKAYYGLANAYLKLKDYDTAYNYYIETIRAKHDFIQAVYNIGHVFKLKNIPIEKLKSELEGFFTEYPNAYPIIADIFYFEKNYEISLEYIKKAEEGGINSENLMILKVKALIRSGKFEECINMNGIDKKYSSYAFLSMYKILSLILINKYDYAMKTIQDLKSNDLSEYNKKMLYVYEQLLKIFTKKPTEILSEDENYKEYTPIIIEVCEIFLINKKFDELETALGLMNLISDKQVLLDLGKLYYEYGYKDMAKKEIIRSIKLFDLIDKDSVDILKECIF